MILLTADWHIKLGQKNVPVQWAKARYRQFFHQIQQIQDVTQHIIPGDIFDRLPSLQQLQLYFQFVKNTKHKTIISTGNHQATKKGSSFFTFLKKATQSHNPLVKVVVDQIYSQGRYYVVPYQYIKKKQTWLDIPQGSYIFTHVRGQIPPHVKPQIDLQWLQKFKLVYAGDLHSHSNSQRNIVYPGSPMTVGFHRNQVSTGYILINQNDLSQWKWAEFKLPQLLRKTVTSEQQIVPTYYHHTIYQIEGDLKSLSTVQKSHLLDKKLVKRAKQPSLILKPQAQIHQQLYQYLLYRQGLQQQAAKKLVGVFHDQIK